VIEDIVGGLVDGLAGGFDLIVGGLIDGLARLAQQVVELLPEASTLALPDMSGWLLGYNWLNSFLPVGEALGYAGVMLAIYGGILVYRLAVVVYHLIPKPLAGT